MKFLKVLGFLIGVPTALLLALLVIGALMKACDYQPSPKSMARDAISECWKQQGRKSLGSGEAQFVAGTCEMMEQRFRDNYKTDP